MLDCSTFKILITEDLVICLLHIYLSFLAVGTQPFARKWEHTASLALISGAAGWRLVQHHTKQYPDQSDPSN